jgi:hypothetical protein
MEQPADFAPVPENFPEMGFQSSYIKNAPKEEIEYFPPDGSQPKRSMHFV